MILDDPFVIVEIGINHGGDIKVAKEMVDAAISAGGKVIKFQCHIPEEEMCGAAKNIIPDNDKRSIYEIVDSCSLAEEEDVELKAYVESKGGTYLSTPFSRAAVDRLERMGVEAYKIGSGAPVDLVEYVGSKGKPVIFSTGICDDAEQKALTLKKSGVPFAALHCVSIYPCPADKVNLFRLEKLARLPGVGKIGYSDHTVSNLAAFAAMGLGATIIERHFADSKDRQGPDIACSMDPSDLSELIAGMDAITQMTGSEFPLQSAARFAEYSVISTVDIPAGMHINPANLVLKRPGIGDYRSLSFFGTPRVADRHINAGVPLVFADVK